MERDRGSRRDGAGAESGLTRALVLSGGGARGAYEAGFLRFLLDELPGRTGAPVRPEILCGTSVGAIHACYVAATADRGTARGAELAAVWQQMSFGDLMRIARPRLWGMRVLPWRKRIDGPQPSAPVWLESGGLQSLMRHSVPWESITRNLSAGLFECLCVVATRLDDGSSAAFFEARKGPQQWTPDPTIRARQTRIRAEHAMASASIPFVLPPIEIDQHYYSDGSLRLNTPLVPALNLGAERMLIVALQAPTVSNERASTPPGSLGLLDGIVAAVMGDRLDTDIARLRFVNELLRLGERSFGSDFLERLNAAASRQGESRLRLVEDCVIRPSADLEAIARDALHDPSLRSRLSQLLLPLAVWFGEGVEDRVTSALSYLLFDRAYTGPLTELGYSDARRNEAELARFFALDG